MLRKILTKIDSYLTLKILFKVISLLLIIFLLQNTRMVWNGWASNLYAILKPFLVGFAVAYILHPLILKMGKIHIPKNLSILIVFLAIALGIVFISFELVPLLSEKIADFCYSMIQGVEWINAKILEYGEFGDVSFMNEISNMIIDFFSSYQSWMPQLMNSIPNMMNVVINFITNALFSIIVAIYVLIDYDQMKHYIVRIFESMFKGSYTYLHEINLDLSVYIHSMLLLVCIRFVEYSTFYFLIGHKDWLIIGIISSIGVLIPYIGGTVANAIGIITGLMLSPSRIIMMIAGICVLANIDAYVISPLIHEKRSDIGPLVSLFAVFAGGVLAGAIGIMLSVPTAIVIRTVYLIYKEKEKDPCVS